MGMYSDNMKSAFSELQYVGLELGRSGFIVLEGGKKEMNDMSVLEAIRIVKASLTTEGHLNTLSTQDYLNVGKAQAVLAKRYVEHFYPKEATDTPVTPSV